MIYEKLPETVMALQWDGANWNIGKKPAWLEKLYDLDTGFLGYHLIKGDPNFSLPDYLYNRSTDYSWPIEAMDWLVYEHDKGIFYVYDDYTFRNKFKKVT